MWNKYKQKNKHFTTTAFFTHHFRYPRKEPDHSPSSKKPKQAKQNKTPLFLNSFLPFSSSTLHCFHLYLRECHSKTIKIATICHIWILQAYTNTVCGFVHCRGCCRLLGCTVKNAPSHGRTLLSFMRGSVGAPWGETTPRINDMRDMHCVTPLGCGGDAGWVI